jgi:hypothetical protein
MLPLDVVNPPITLLLVLMFALFAVALAIVIFKDPTTAGLRWVVTVIACFVGGVSLAVAVLLISDVAPQESVISWASERYGLVLDADDVSELKEKKFITLNDGTSIIMTTPTDDAEGYLLYTLNKEELPVR